MKTYTFSATSPKELEAEIQKVISEDFIPTMACVFCSVAQPLEQIHAIFARYHIAVFGCTSSGEIANSNAFEESITVMLFDLPKETFKIKTFDGVDKTSFQLGQEVATWAKSIFATPALLLLSAGLQADGEAIVRGAIDSMGYEFPLFGGLACQRLEGDWYDQDHYTGGRECRSHD